PQQQPGAGVFGMTTPTGFGGNTGGGAVAGFGVGGGAGVFGAGGGGQQQSFGSVSSSSGFGLNPGQGAMGGMGGLQAPPGGFSFSMGATPTEKFNPPPGRKIAKMRGKKKT
ncbi:hypothetical protein DFQ26_009581, partial [Actinomortierella ambigua]